MLYRVTDLNFDAVLTGHYHAGFFASGYEERCTYVPSRVNRQKVARPIVCGFAEVGDHAQRIENERYFTANWSSERLIISGDDDRPIYKCLDDLGARQDLEEIKILVDYSSMSRLWYAAILNWARFALNAKRLSIDCLYAVGDHKATIQPMVIKEMICIPGCEGRQTPLLRSVAVFGLGFEGMAALCVLDRLEPDEIFAFVAAPAAFDDYPERARKENRELIKLAKNALEFSLFSVEMTFKHLAELIAPFKHEASITIIPMGPKPHVLAALLLSMRFEEIACLRVSGTRQPPEAVGTTGDIVATRVEFRRV